MKSMYLKLIEEMKYAAFSVEFLDKSNLKSICMDV
jgi:hypothetical protein